MRLCSFQGGLRPRRYAIARMLNAGSTSHTASASVGIGVNSITTLATTMVKARK